MLTSQINDDLQQGRKLRLNLGAGGPGPEGFYCIDHLPLPGIDIVADLNQPLSLLPDNSVEEIVTSHTLEHIQNFLPLMAEMHRILAPGGQLRVIVPHFSSTLAYSDPTHVRFFGLYTMAYFADPADQPETRKVPAFYTPTRFKILETRIHFENWGTLLQRRLGPFMTRFWNKNERRQHLYESRFAYLYPADELRYTLSPVK